VKFQEQEFILNGGPPKWFEGVEEESIPKKLTNLLPIVQILSHQPWVLGKDHIGPLVKGEDSWSIAELVHAMSIICTFNSLAGIVYGCGVTEEIDLGDNYSASSYSHEEEEQDITSQTADDTKKITDLLKGTSLAVEEAAEQHELFAKAETVPMRQLEMTEESSSKYENVSDLRRYLGKYYMKYEDFDVKSRVYSIFRVQDWNWKEDGFELARRFLPGAAALLDEEWDHILSMTYNKFNKDQNVDTYPFRRAIWQYVQRIKGAFHDDYNYQEVNIYLNISAKNYIKKISCYPSNITKNDFQDVGYELTHDEKVHVALLAVESAKQSALLYGLHAVMKHMFNK